MLLGILIALAPVSNARINSLTIVSLRYPIHFDKISLINFNLNILTIDFSTSLHSGRNDGISCWYSNLVFGPLTPDF
jgi:hypothetical protein